MPPKAKFANEEIIMAALDIVRESGLEALTARSLGSRLGSSASPIFTVFNNMEEVVDGVTVAARGIYTEYVEKGLSEETAFRGVGIQYIVFAMNEPKLFQLLFMIEQKAVPGLSNVLQMIDENYEKILKSITRNYTMTDEQAEKMYHHLWIYTHGIATLCATKMYSFTAEEITELLTDVFTGLLLKMRGEK